MPLTRPNLTRPSLDDVTDFEGKVVDRVRSIQRPVVERVRRGVERAEGHVPKLRVPASLPRPDTRAGRKIVQSQIDFAKALFETQRTFVRELADAVSPLVEREESKPARKTAAETPAKTTSSKKKSTRSSKTTG